MNSLCILFLLSYVISYIIILRSQGFKFANEPKYKIEEVTNENRYNLVNLYATTSELVQFGNKILDDYHRPNTVEVLEL